MLLLNQVFFDLYSDGNDDSCLFLFTEAPPSYEDLFGQVRAAKSQSSSVAEFLKKVFIIVLGTSKLNFCLTLRELSESNFRVNSYCYTSLSLTGLIESCSRSICVCIDSKVSLFFQLAVRYVWDWSLRFLLLWLSLVSSHITQIYVRIWQAKMWIRLGFLATWLKKNEHKKISSVVIILLM